MSSSGEGTYCEVPVPLPEVTIFSSAPLAAAAAAGLLDPLDPSPMAEAVDASATASEEEILVDAVLGSAIF